MYIYTCLGTYLYTSLMSPSSLPCLRLKAMKRGIDYSISRPEGGSMSGPYDGQTYLDARPRYPPDWYQKLSALTPAHVLAWDAGTGNGQAAVGVAEYYESVIATDISEGQLQHAIPHPRVRYVHTPVSLSENELISSVRGDNSVDLITVAAAVHWFDLDKFYSAATRVLKKPGGVIAVWSYSDIMMVNPEFDALQEKFRLSALPYWNPGVKYVFEEYRNLPFPFESVGMGAEREPLKLSMTRDLNFDSFLAVMRTFSAVATAKERGVDLLSEAVVKEFEEAWGGPPDAVKTVTYNMFLIAGKVMEQCDS